MKQHDITKLPKWAQQEIERLRRDLQRAEQRLSVGPEDSNVFADPYSNTPRPLGRDTQVSFQAEDDAPARHAGGFKVGLGYGRDGSRYLEVYGGDALSIQPHSSNVVRIKLERWW